MEGCDELRKKPKRSFVEAWLSDERYKSWIRKISSDESLYFCTVCNESFSCNAAHVSRHADSACHRNNLKGNISLSNDNDESEKHTTANKPVFQYAWLDLENFKSWLRAVPHDKSACFCAICDKYFAARLAQIRRHTESKCHINLCRKKGIEASESNDFNTQDNESFLSFDERTKSLEVKYAAFIAENNIPHQTAENILNFFQQVDDLELLKNMTMGRAKCKNVICNVLHPVENEYVVYKLQRTKFSVFIDKTSDICNEKWMIFFVRYVDPDTLDIRSQLIKLINIKARGSSAEKLFHEFKSEMWKMQIPFSNIIALSCDNASVMTGKHSSFKTRLEKMCKQVLTFPCPCHSAALAAHAACAKLPSFCEFFEKIANYINSSPKRSAIFQEFTQCSQEKHIKILKLSDTRWLSHYTFDRLLHSWKKIRNFLQETVDSDQTKLEEYLLTMMDNVELKAYFLFLKYILDFFNSFNAFFQSTETRIHLLQLKSVDFLSNICKNFVKMEYLKDVVTIDNFSYNDIQKNEIFLGSECENYLNDLIAEGHVDTVATVRHNCSQFYITAAKEIKERLPIRDRFLTSLTVFGPAISLRSDNRETSFKHVSFVARTIGGFDKDSLQKEWLELPKHFTNEEKDNISKYNFDEMWKKILQCQLSHETCKYPSLTNLLSAVRSLPNSNADPERAVSILTDLKCKKRNKLSSTSVNATCVVKSALKTRGETAVKMTITEQHLSRMSSDILYASTSKREKSSFTLYAADEVAGPSSSTQ